MTERALELREHLASLWDFPSRQAVHLAKCVAQWTWEHNGAGISHAPEIQRLRGYRSGNRRRQRAHNRDNEIIAWRDSHGKSWREIAKLMNMTAEGARKAYARKVKEQEGKGNG